MADLRSFNANQITPTDMLETVPSGNYVVEIIDSEYKPTKAGSGSYLQFTLQIADGPCRDRLLWVRLNLKNLSPTIVRLAEQQLAAIYRAVDVSQVTDSSELHHRPFSVRVLKQSVRHSGESRNTVVGFRRLSASERLDDPVVVS